MIAPIPRRNPSLSIRISRIFKMQFKTMYRCHRVESHSRRQAQGQKRKQARIHRESDGAWMSYVHVASGLEGQYKAIQKQRRVVWRGDNGSRPAGFPSFKYGGLTNAKQFCNAIR